MHYRTHTHCMDLVIIPAPVGLLQKINRSLRRIKFSFKDLVHQSSHNHNTNVDIENLIAISFTQYPSLLRTELKVMLVKIT